MHTLYKKQYTKQVRKKMQCDDLEKTNDFYNTFYIYNNKKIKSKYE